MGGELAVRGPASADLRDPRAKEPVKTGEFLTDRSISFRFPTVRLIIVSHTLTAPEQEAGGRHGS